MSYNSATQIKKEPSLKDVLTTILDDFGVSKQGVEKLICLLDANISSVVDENDKYLFKFENTEIQFDFGTQLNSSIKSSYIMIYLNHFLDLKKIELHFLTDEGEDVIIANYNSDYEFVNLKYDNPQMRKIKERIKLEHEMNELKKLEEQNKKLEEQKKMEQDLLLARIEKNKKIISAIQEKLKFLNDNEDYFEYICNNFLLKGCQYEEWKINNFKKFTIYQSDKGFSIHTNIFNTGIFPNKSNLVIQKCIISFNSDMEITNFNFKIKQVKIGNCWMYSFQLDSKFNLNEICRTDIITGQKLKHNAQCCNGVIFEEIVSILKFKLSDNDVIYETIPEVIVPSAYNFNSEEFKKRLLIAEMLLV